MVGLSAARIHGPPGPVELPGVDAPFVPARISADRPHNESYDDKSGMRSAELTCPYATTLSDSQRERGRQADCLPLCYDRTRDRMGARVMASGMPGVSRRAVLGGATYSVVKVWARLSGAGRPAAASQSAPHPWRASSPRHVRSAWSGLPVGQG